MRTTVEITDEQRAKLLKLAAERREKGFSGVVQEALDHYFEAELDRRERVAAALEALGSLAAEEAEALERDVRKLRRTWR
ncbi:MAG: hypothetical protein AAF604_06010 [Acidobacteriota bacterium]